MLSKLTQAKPLVLVLAAASFALTGCGVDPEKLCSHASSVSKEISMNDCVKSATLAKTKRPDEYKTGAKCALKANNEKSLGECLPLEFLLSEEAFNAMILEQIKPLAELVKLEKTALDLTRQACKRGDPLCQPEDPKARARFDASVEQLGVLLRRAEKAEEFYGTSDSFKRSANAAAEADRRQNEELEGAKKKLAQLEDEKKALEEALGKAPTPEEKNRLEEKLRELEASKGSGTPGLGGGKKCRRGDPLCSDIQ